MRRVSVLLAILTLTSLNACELFTGPELTIQVQGTITAADFGYPITGASVRVTGTCLFFCDPPTFALTTTDASGSYSLSFETEGKCAEVNFFLGVTAEGFRPLGFSSKTHSHITCAQEVQTIDIQLVRWST